MGGASVCGCLWTSSTTVAARYDESTLLEFDPAVVSLTVDVLAELAGDGAALEFAVGTGRVALPLAARGVRVSGIELSPPWPVGSGPRTTRSSST